MRSAAIKVAGIEVRALHRSRGCSTAFPVRFRFSRELTTRSAAFTQASENVNKLPNVDNSTKLQLYALYKQATSGPNKTAKPGERARLQSAPRFADRRRRYRLLAGRPAVDGRPARCQTRLALPRVRAV